ncbi:MAG: NAD-dependent epimerase/dehydratase family protein [Pyrinomonadaceae bacterium]
MKVLVTGATGFVGKAIVAGLIKGNFGVFCLGGLSKENTDKLPNFFKADIADTESLGALDGIKNLDVIIHSAGLAHQFGEVRKDDFWKINVEGTKNVARLGAELKIRHFILISSVAVYGNVKKRGDKKFIDEKFLCEPGSIYAQSKLESEQAAIEICEQNNIPLTILRLSTVIGENDRGNTARLIEAIDKRLFVWIGKGENYKSLIYKNDVAGACLKILDKKTSKTEVFNVSAEPVLMKDVVSEISAALNKKVPGMHVSVKLLERVFRLNSKVFRLKRVFNLSETTQKWLSEDVYSGDKIASEYGFRAETPVSEAIRRQVEAYKNRKC